MFYLTNDFYGLFDFIFGQFIQGTVFSPEDEVRRLSKCCEFVWMLFIPCKM